MTSAPGDETAASRHLLVVDDHPINRAVATAFATRLGWQVAEAAGGERAMALLTERPFDLLLLDISMPSLDGENVLARLRAIPALRHLKVVAYTAHALVEEKRRLLEAGFDDLLIKPITLQALAEVLGGAPAAGGAPVLE
jgi:CheY-like chemotaxis protein